MTKWEGVIGVENKLTEDGRFVDPGAIIWDEETPLPLYLSSPDGMQLIGIVEAVWREGYLLRARGEFRPEFELPENARALGMELGQAVFDHDENPEGLVTKMNVHEGRLRRVCLYDGIKPAWPECLIEAVS